MQKAANVYMQTKVGTTDQGQLLLMLYDGALTFLAQARDKMLARDFAAKGQLISRAIDIVNELASSLNMEKGGTLAENLNNLYFLCTARLLQANLKMNVEQLDSVVQILSSLRGAYAQIVDKPEARHAVQQIEARIQPEASNTQRTLDKIPQAAPAPMGQLQARAAYQMAASKFQSAPAAQAASAAPGQAVDPAQPQAPAQAAEASRPAPAAQGQTPAAPAATASAAGKPQAAVKIPYAPPAAQPQAPAPSPAQAPAPMAGGVINFNKKLAAYGKTGV